jgi:hypothetical protein
MIFFQLGQGKKSIIYIFYISDIQINRNILRGANAIDSKILTFVFDVISVPSRLTLKIMFTSFDLDLMHEVNSKSPDQNIGHMGHFIVPSSNTVTLILLTDSKYISGKFSNRLITYINRASSYIELDFS